MFKQLKGTQLSPSRIGIRIQGALTQRTLLSCHYASMANSWQKLTFPATHTPWQTILINQAPPHPAFGSGTSSITRGNYQQQGP